MGFIPSPFNRLVKYVLLICYSRKNYYIGDVLIDGTRRNSFYAFNKTSGDSTSREAMFNSNLNVCCVSNKLVVHI